MLHQKMQVLEKQYDRVLPWYASLYEPTCGGFYGTVSGRDDPTFSVGVEMSGSAITALHNHAPEQWAVLPTALHTQFIHFFRTHYNAESGYFEEPALIPMDRDATDRSIARIQAFSKNALQMLGAPVPSPADATGTWQTPTLPAQFDSPQKYVDWMKTLSWSTNPWAAADRIQASQNYIRLMPPTQRTPYLDMMFDYLEATQQFDTGYWGVGDSYCALSGAFKVDLIYNAHDRTLPHPEKILHTVFHTIATHAPENVYYIRNALDLLHTLATRYSYADTIRAELPQYLDKIINAIQQFRAPDGGFSATVGQAKTEYGGVWMGHGLHEGDVDATLMMLIARRILYTLFQLPIPPLAAPKDFWSLFSSDVK